MPLESLSQPFNPDEPGRKLREVQVEHEPEKESEARKRFEYLKNTPLYDGGTWRAGILDGEVRAWSSAATTLGLVCEVALGNNLTREELASVESKSDFDFSFIGRTDVFKTALMALALLRPRSAQEQFKKIKEKNPTGRSDISNFGAPVVYVGLLLGDADMTRIAQNDKEYLINPHPDLYNILLNTELNPVLAKQQWDAVKHSPDYVNEAGYFMNDDGGLDYIDTQLQLRAVLIEARLEAKGMMDDAKPEHLRKLPEERQF